MLVSLTFQRQHLNNGYKDSSRRPCQGKFRQLYFEENCKIDAVQKRHYHRFGNAAIFRVQDYILFQHS